MGKGLCSSSGQSKGSKHQPSDGSSKPESAGNSPLDEPRPGEPGAKEKTPELAAKKPANDGDPDSPKADPPGESKNRLGGPPPRRATEHSATPNAADRWGDLPIHAREVFLNASKSDLPPEYVDWIDAYYKRLNELK